MTDSELEEENKVSQSKISDEVSEYTDELYFEYNFSLKKSRKKITKPFFISLSGDLKGALNVLPYALRQ